MLTKTQLKETFLKYNFRPLKRFGENYLIDTNIKDKIIATAEPKAGDTILEIGPGLGALTMDLAGSGASVYAVEKDKKAFGILSDLAGDKYPNLKIFCEDILEFDIESVIKLVIARSEATKRSDKVKVVGNLPYYITTPIIEMLINHRSAISSAVILVQREVADRLLAGPGSKEYSSLSCFVNYYTKPKYIHTVKPAAFFPEPEVDSSVVKLEFLDKPSVEVRDETLFFKVVRGAFNQRRKTIMNSLSREVVLDLPKADLAAILARAGVDPMSRPETLGLEQFAAITNSIL
jgi:16S rRNA (adenine1518-N6/adenine1519-N6)-dimethyltransferase